MCNVNAAVDNGYNDILPAGRVFLPYRPDVAVSPLLCTDADRPVIVIMPLLCQKRVVKSACRRLLHGSIRASCRIRLCSDSRPCNGQDTFGVFHSLRLAELLYDSSNILAVVEIDSVPAVKSRCHGPCLIDSCGFEDPFHPVGTGVLHGGRHRRGYALHLYLPASGSRQGGTGSLRQLHVDTSLYCKEVLVDVNGACTAAGCFHVDTVLTRHEHHTRERIRT